MDNEPQHWIRFEKSVGIAVCGWKPLKGSWSWPCTQLVEHVTCEPCLLKIFELALRALKPQIPIQDRERLLVFLDAAMEQGAGSVAEYVMRVLVM